MIFELICIECYEGKVVNKFLFLLGFGEFFYESWCLFDWS